MNAVSLAEAKARLSALVERARTGESVCITRRGKPVARLVPAEAPRETIDAAELRALTDRLPRQEQSAGDFLREMRDDARY
jgi:prevent-host-death family protein